jgi:transcription elongation GreA/GreB family factor
LNKQTILNLVIEQLHGDLRITMDATRAAYEAATHEESRAEDQYDTRGLEASYLANAQSQRATELDKMVVGLKSLTIKDFSAEEAINVGAIVELEQADRKMYVFLLPYGAGINVTDNGKSISVVTPAAPLGQELLNRHAGDDFRISNKGNVKEYEILRVY